MERDGGERNAAKGPGGTLLAVVLAAVTFASGCGSGGTPPPRPAVDGGAAARQAGLQPGDGLLIAIWREPDLSDTVQVNDEGRVVLPLLGPREVTGISPDSLERQLEAEYTRYVKSPAVSVTALRRISILGEVKQPGLYPVDATIALSDALAMAGGLTPNADRSDIRLIRDGRVMRETLDRSMLVGRLPIRSGDQIVVGQRPWFQRNWQWIGGTVATFALWGLFRG